VAGAVPFMIFGVFADTGASAERANVVSAQLPVWTPELGEVPLDKYSREELDKMVADFWTPERIRNAIPLEPLAVDEVGYEKALKATPMQAWEPAKMLSEPALPQANNPYAPYATSVTNKGRANGKLYFYDARDNQEYHCSAAAMNSSSKRLVATAAHCIHAGGPEANWNYNIRFIPNYHWGDQPDGEFQWSEYNGYNGYYAWMPPDWITYGQIMYGPNAYRGAKSDFVFITTNNNANGQRLVEAVGGHGLWTHNGGPLFDANIFGYPGNIAYGQAMQACWGSTQSIQRGIYDFSAMYDCNFGGGGSGGPWLDWYNNATGIGQLRSVTSFGNGSYIAGPIFYSNVVGPLFYFANLDSDW